jgi:hypothetical protein
VDVFVLTLVFPATAFIRRNLCIIIQMPFGNYGMYGGNASMPPFMQQHLMVSIRARMHRTHS